MIHGDVDRTIALLNEWNRLDPIWVRQLFKFYPRCSKELASHPDLQSKQVGNRYYSASVLGLINGLHGYFDEGPREGWGPITAIWDEDGRNILRFEKTANEVVNTQHSTNASDT